MRILLLSAYDAASHRAWRECLQEALGDWHWTVLAQPPRHFSWRIRGNPLSWALEQRETLEADYDLLLATSMVDLATLRGLVPALGQLPAVLYFHENQFAYPPGKGWHGQLEAQMVTLYGALAADCLVFNSAYNRDTFLRGCAELLQRLPDGIPADVVERLSHKSQLLPVPLAFPQHLSSTGASAGASAGLQILWNHRWEYDKGPEGLLELVRGLLRRKLDFCLHVAGQQFREQPEEFATLHETLREAGALGCWGYVEDRTAYRALLQGCDVVLSTARHDFQGLAMLEAVAEGCYPLAPRRLVYPEWFPQDCLYENLEHAAGKLERLAQDKEQGRSLGRIDVSDFASDRLVPRYRELLRSQAGHKTVS